jgi:hypothetical protein
MTSRSALRRLVLVSTMALASGCGSDNGEAPGADGGVPDADVDEGTTYESPEDFDRTGCTGGLGDLDPAGIWHMAIDFQSSSSASAGYLAHDTSGANLVADVLRIDRVAGGELEALLFGTPVDEVSHTDSDLFLRHAYEGRDGSELVRAWTACALRPGGELFGRYANCRGTRCLVGTFEAYRLEPLDEPAASGIRAVSEYGGPSASPWPVDVDYGHLTINVRHLEGVAYVARYYDGLRIVDVSSPAAPVELGHAPVAEPDFEFYNDVKVIRGTEDRIYAIVASSERGAVVIDVTDPASPTEVGSFPEPAEGDGWVDVHTLFIDQDRAYLANLSTLGLDVFDVSDPRAPQHLGSYVDEAAVGGNEFVHDLYVGGGRAYLNHWSLGLVVVDVSDPASITRVGGFDDYAPRTSHSNWVTQAGGRLVSVHGDEGFDAHVRIIDVDSFEAIGSYQTRPQVSVHNILADGELAYVTYYQDGLRLLDLSNPASPQEVAHYQTWPGAEPGYGRTFFEGAIGVDLDAERDLILVADTHRGLLILERVSE